MARHCRDAGVADQRRAQRSERVARAGPTFEQTERRGGARKSLGGRALERRGIGQRVERLGAVG